MRTRTRIRTLVVAAAAAAAVAVAALGATPAAAEADHGRTLRRICEANDGTFVPHPLFWRARCQGSRPSGGADDGLRAPFMICTMQMAGQFTAGTAADGTTSWVCR